MVEQKITAKELFEQDFLFTRKYQGQTCNSIDELMKILDIEYPQVKFVDYEFKSKKSDDVFNPFSYVVAKFKSGIPASSERLGFKLDSENFIRIGSPYYEETQENAGVFKTGGFRLYESSKKEKLLLVCVNQD